MTKNAIDPRLLEIEQLTKAFADAHNQLVSAATELETEVQTTKRRRLPMIRARAAKTKAARAELLAKLQDHPDLFKRPKSREFFGVRIGWMKGKGSIQFKDAEALVAKIKKQLPDQAGVLTDTKVKPVKAALQQLSADILKKLGVSVVDATDEPFVKPQEGDVLKQVAAWLESEADGGGSK
jgi:arsenate reductase-like glutaredoxin family protein